MRLALDATPLLGRPTGVGRYVAGLVQGLAALPDAPELVLTGFSWRGIPDHAPAGARWATRRAPARGLQALWSRVGWPPVELLSGPCDVFHATNYVLPPTRRAAGVVSVHDLSFALHADTVTPEVLRYQQLVPRGLRRARAVLTLSEATADEVAEHYHLDRSLVHAARPGVGTEWFATPPPTNAWREEHGLPPSYLLFVGTQEPRKNLPVLLEALRLLQRDGVEHPPLMLAGPAGWGGPVDDSDLLPGSVRRLGYVDDEVLRGTVAGAAVLVFPSRHEGFGLPPLEALACGTPVVSSDLPVLREVTGDQALYAAVGDPADLAARLLDALADPSGTPGRLARQEHARAFTWERCAREAMAVYASVDHRRPARH